MNVWLTVFGGALGTAALTLLGFVLYRSDRASKLAGTAIETTSAAVRDTGRNFRYIAILREVIYKQGDQLDKWEDWGVDVRRDWRALQRDLLENGSITKIHDLPLPPRHLDLSELLAKLPHFDGDGQPTEEKT